MQPTLGYDIENLQTRDNLYDYEKDFVKIWQGAGLEVFTQGLGKVPKDHRNKNFTNDLWENCYFKST